MAYFLYKQNNTGGFFDIDTDEGISEYVIIEAKNTSEANTKAEEIGIYFNGVEKEKDCECCGDRWHDSPEELTEDEFWEYKESAFVSIHLD